MKTHLPKYVNALCQEQRIISESVGKRIQVGTIFFGGGTPSLLSPDQFHEIQKTAAECFELQESAEITIEANPGTVNEDYLKEIHSLGINRVSFGMQSAHPEDLRLLDRQHRHEDVIRAVEWSKKAGFQHINLDLIFGIPGQTIDRWLTTLDLALAENIDHFSLYSLSIEDGTPLQRWLSRGLLPEPDDDLAGEMYEAAMDKLEQAGFLQYEISNWAKFDQRDNRCQHNVKTWRYLPYLGFGAGAHGFFDGTRTENTGGILEYIDLVNHADRKSFPAGPACSVQNPLSIWEQMQEYMMVGFRLTDEGVSRKDFYNRFNHAMDALFKIQIGRLMKQRLIENHPNDQDRLRLTMQGRLFGNQVFAQFVGNKKPSALLKEDLG